MIYDRLKIYYYFLRQFRRNISTFLFFSVCLSITYAALIATLYPFISFSLNQSGNHKNTGFILEYITGLISKIPIADPLVSASMVLIVLSLFLAFFRYSSTSSSLDLSYAVNYSLQKDIYEKVLNSDMNYFIDNKQGDILFRIKDPPLKTGYIIKDSAILIRES